MKPPFLRIVKSEEEERRISQLQYDAAYKDYIYLVVQSLCFKKYKSYTRLLDISRKFKQDGNLNQYITGIKSLRYLYELGAPSALAQRNVSEALKFVKDQAAMQVLSRQERENRQLLSRLYLIAKVFNFEVEQYQIVEISLNLQKNQNPIWFLNKVAPLKKLLAYESADF